MTTSQEWKGTPDRERPRNDIEADILRAIRAVRFGSVEVIVHDSQVVQIERKEKVRFDRRAHKET